MPEKGIRRKAKPVEKSFPEGIYELPVVVKDELPDVVADYQDFLTGNGVPKLDVIRATEYVEKIVFGGDPRKTARVVEALGKLQENQKKLNST